MPFHAYRGWKERFSPTTRSEQSDVASEAAVVLIGDVRVDESIESLEAQRHSAWSAVSLPARAFSQFDPKAAREFVDGDAAGSAFFVFCLSGTILAEDALQRFADLFASEPGCDMVYGDVEVGAGAGAVWPLAFSAFDLERALEQGYGAYCFAVRRERALDALRSATSLYDIFLCCVEPGRTYHLPGSVAALPRIDASAATSELVAASKAYFARARHRGQCRAAKGRPSSGRSGQARRRLEGAHHHYHSDQKSRRAAQAMHRDGHAGGK
ncbi:hypothetical protein [Bradyrhizobium elkanii]